MNRKPRGAKYRNLHLRGPKIYYQREIRGKRIRFSCETSDWNEAASIRDLYEEKKGVGRLPSVTWDVPTFSAFAQRYLGEDTQHLAATTRSDRNSYLREDGPLHSYFGGRRLDEITVPMLREWWNAEIIN